MADKDLDQLNDLLEDALTDLLAKDDSLEESPEQISKLKTPRETAKKQAPQVTGGIDDEKLKSVLENAIKDEAGGSGSGADNAFGVDEEQMNKFFENMTTQLKDEMAKIDPEEARARIDESLPQVFDMMQNLLSKELLYPALKELSPKFDDWLKKNSSSLPKEDRKRYRKQAKLINEMVYVFDNETLDGQEMFEKNLDIMQKMQELGPAPPELSVPDSVGKCSII